MIVIVSLFIGVIAYYMSVKIIEVEITKAHEKSLVQVKNVSDNILKELEMLYIQVGFDDTMQMLMSLEQVKEPVQLLEMEKIEKELKRHLLTYPVIDDVYLYFERSENVLSNYGRHNIETFFQSGFEYGTEKFKYDPELFRQWVQSDYTGIDIFSVADEDGNEKNMVAYIRGLPVGRVDNFLGKLVVIVNDDLINGQMNKFEWIKEGRRFAINKDDKIFLDDNTGGMEFDGTYAGLQCDTVVDPNSDTVISCVQSDVFDWKYVYIIPKNIFFEKAKMVKNYILFSILFILCLGFFLSYFFARKYYAPIDKLIMFIQNNLKELKNQDEDEYNFIKKIISNTLSEKEAYQENIKKFSDRLKNDFLMQLFRGKLNNNAIQHMKKLHNVDVSDEANYIIMTAYLDDISLMHYEDFSDAEMDEKLDIAWLILKSTLDELLLQGELKSLSVKEDDLIYYLIDTGDIKPEEAFTQVRTIKNKLIDLSKNKFKISIFVALSNVHKGYEGIKKAYSQTDKAVEYYLLTGKEQAEPEQPDKLERPKTISFDFRKDIEQFTQSILAKEIGQAKNLLNNIFAKWFVQGRPPADIVKYRMSEVINACINSIENIKMSYDNHFMDCMQMMNILFNCKNTEDLQAEIQKILDYLEEYITEMDNSEPDIIQKSVRYMDDNYYDSDLNISSLANHFDINAPYLSRQFKKNTGMGPLEYLQLKRIEESKKLLRQTNESIKEISQKVGFTYEVSFIRVFKKFEGVTPGIFRG
jgi:AraC-like DNA-binding protein